MRAARPARSVVARCVSSTRTAAAAAAPPRGPPCRQLHVSAPRPARKPRFRNVKAEEMGLLKPENLDRYQREKMPDYSAEELEALRREHTPEQFEALRAAEAAVDPKDVVMQGRLRDDHFRPQYIEDYRRMDPRYDVRPESTSGPESTPRPQKVQWLETDEWVDRYGMRMSRMLNAKTDAQLTRAMVRALRKVKQGVGQDLLDLTEDELQDLEQNPELLQRYVVDDHAPDPDSDADAAELDASAPDVMTREQAIKLDDALDVEWKKQLEQLENFSTDEDASPSAVELLEGTPAGSVGLSSAEQPELGKVPGVEGKFRTGQDEEGDAAGEYDEARRTTGMTLAELKSLFARPIVRRFVHNQTRLGKIRSISIMTIAGNGDGRLGIGMAKSTSPEVAGLTSRMLALRNMKPIRRYENRTIYGTVKAKVSGTVVELFSRPPGFGLRVPHRIFEMCRACGIHDLAAKMPRSKNPMNSVKATYKALTGQPDPESMAVGRGKKLVDVRKVYYGGSVH